MFTVGIIGGSAYTRTALLRLCASHPDLTIEWATGDTHAGSPVVGLYPSLAAAYPELVYCPYTPELMSSVDLVFCTLPHGASQAIVPELRTRVKHVVDLAA